MSTNDKLTILEGGHVKNESVRIDGGEFEMKADALLETGTLDILNNDQNTIFNGTIVADTILYRGEKGSNLKVDLGQTEITARELRIIGQPKLQQGLRVSAQSNLEHVDSVIVEFHGARTGLNINEKVDVGSAITLLNNTFLGSGEGARLEVEKKGTGSRFSNVGIGKGKNLIQANDGAEFTINHLELAGKSTLNFQTTGSSDSASKIELSEVILNNGSKLYTAIYGASTPHLTLSGEDVNLFLGKGALADLAGVKNTDWRTDFIRFDAGRLTVTVADSNDGKIYGSSLFLVGKAQAVRPQRA